MALTEIQRQEYLEVMGIQSYFPRYQLPGARVSVLADNSSGQESLVEPLVETSVAAAETGVELSVNTVSPQNLDLSNTHQSLQEPQVKNSDAERIQELGSILDRTSEVEANSSQNSPEPQIAKVTSVVDNATVDNLTDDIADVRFRLAVFRVSDNICVLNQVPYVGLNQALPPGHQALFTKICQSLNLTQSPVDFDLMQTFNWPFDVQANLDNSAGAAQSGIRAYLEQQHSVQAFDTLIVMGEMLSRYCSSSVAATSASDSASDAGVLWKTINTPSLDEMLKAWQFKRDAWMQLRKLKFLH